MPPLYHYSDCIFELSISIDLSNIISLMPPFYPLSLTISSINLFPIYQENSPLILIWLSKVIVFALLVFFFQRIYQINKENKKQKRQMNQQQTTQLPLKGLVLHQIQPKDSIRYVEPTLPNDNYREFNYIKSCNQSVYAVPINQGKYVPQSTVTEHNPIHINTHSPITGDDFQRMQFSPIPQLYSPYQQQNSQKQKIESLLAQIEKLVSINEQINGKNEYLEQENQNLKNVLAQQLEEKPSQTKSKDEIQQQTITQIISRKEQFNEKQWYENRIRELESDMVLSRRNELRKQVISQKKVVEKSVVLQESNKYHNIRMPTYNRYSMEIPQYRKQNEDSSVGCF